MLGTSARSQIIMSNIESEENPNYEIPEDVSPNHNKYCQLTNANHKEVLSYTITFFHTTVLAKPVEGCKNPRHDTQEALIT